MRGGAGNPLDFVRKQPRDPDTGGLLAEEVTSTRSGEISIETINVKRRGTHGVEVGGEATTGKRQGKTNFPVSRAGGASDDTAAGAQQVAVKRLARSDGGKREVVPHVYIAVRRVLKTHVCRPGSCGPEHKHHYPQRRQLCEKGFF